MSRPGVALALVRLAVGAGGWARPKALLRFLGARDADDPAHLWVARMFAVRDAALGVGVVCTTGAPRRFWLQLGLACDAADLAAGILAARGPGNRRAGLKITPLIGVGLGAAALRQEAKRARV